MNQDYDSLSKQQKEIFKEALRRYPIGTSVKSLNRYYTDRKTEIKNHDFYCWYGKNLYLHGTDTQPLVYSDGVWAETRGESSNYQIF